MGRSGHPKPWGQGSLERSLIGEGEGERNMSPIFDICYKEKITIKYIEITWIENRYIYEVHTTHF